MPRSSCRCRSVSSSGALLAGRPVGQSAVASRPLLENFWMEPHAVSVRRWNDTVAHDPPDPVTTVTERWPSRTETLTPPSVVVQARHADELLGVEGAFGFAGAFVVAVAVASVSAWVSVSASVSGWSTRPVRSGWARRRCSGCTVARALRSSQPRSTRWSGRSRRQGREGARRHLVVPAGRGPVRASRG
jgi:hypothetical protein